MKKLIDECKDHNYIFLSRRTRLIDDSIQKQIITLETYACIDCGSGLEVYDLDNVKEAQDEKKPEDH